MVSLPLSCVMLSITTPRRFIPTLRAGGPRSGRRPHLPRDRLRLQEQAEVLAAAGLRIGAGHVEAAERMHAHERARALAVQVEIADEEPLLGAAGLPRTVGEDHPGRSARRATD